MSGHQSAEVDTSATEPAVPESAQGTGAPGGAIAGCFEPRAVLSMQRFAGNRAARAALARQGSAWDGLRPPRAGEAHRGAGQAPSGSATQIRAGASTQRSLADAVAARGRPRGAARVIQFELQQPTVARRTDRQLIQRNGKGKGAGGDLVFQVFVPQSVTTLEGMYRLFERVAYGRELNHTWRCNDFCDMSKNSGTVVHFRVTKASVEAETTTDTATKDKKSKQREEYLQLKGDAKKEITDEANRRYYKLSGDKPGTAIQPSEKGKAQTWEYQLADVLAEQQTLKDLPAPVKELLGSESSYKPANYEQLLRIAAKIQQFAKEDFGAYKLLAIRATDNLDLFEKSIELYLARKEELRKAMEQQPSQPGKEPTLQDRLDAQLKDLDPVALNAMSEDERYRLAREKTSQLTAEQLKYMKEHPGEVAKDFLKSATLVNTPETFSAIGKDLQEAATGDANTFARWAAGTGAGAKMSGWLMAVAGILFVASWLTGVGELATIAAGAAILLGATVTLSVAESELRIKAASQAKTEEEFKRNVQLAAAARTNVIVAVSLIIIAALLHFTAKAFFPKQVQAVKLSLKNLREKIRLKGSVYELKPKISAELGQRRGDLVASAEAAKSKALESATELERLSTEEFVDRVEKGDQGFLDQSKVPPEQRLNFRELLGTKEGRTAIEQYKQRLVDALKKDVPAQIDKLLSEYTSKIDDFLKEVEAAKNHDDLSASVDKLDKALTEERLKEAVADQQAKLTEQKLEEAAGEAHKELIAAVKEAVVKRVKARIAEDPAKFGLVYSEAELDAIIAKGKELGLSSSVIEDMIYTGSRKAKAISAADLMQEMENWGNVVSKRGFPYRFADLEQFKAFSKDLIDGVRSVGLPVDDVRVQGSALRRPTANDVDLAVFVEQSVFDKLLIDRFHARIAKGTTKISLTGKSHAELAALAADIEANPGSYNAQAGTFQNAVKTGIISSKSDIIKPLKTVRADIAAKYPHLNIEAISVLLKGGKFELKPDLAVKQ